MVRRPANEDLARGDKELELYDKKRMIELENENKGLRQEIEEGRKREEELRESEEKFRTIFKNADDSIAFVGNDATITDINDRIRDVLGYEPEEVIGTNFAELGLLRGEQLQETVEYLQDIIAGKPSPMLELELMHKDGRGVFVELNSTVIKKEGETIGILCITRDITERKKSEAELARYRDHLEDLVKGRTIELENANKQLRKEIEERKRAEETLRESKKTLQFLSSRLFQAQESERRRLSIELHDELGQDLALLKHRLRSIERELREDQPSIREACEDTNRYLDQILENVRRLSRDLSPYMLEDVGLSAALRWLVEEFDKQHSVQMSIVLVDIDDLFSVQAQINIYRISQEMLTNIDKHAQASHVSFVVKKDEEFVLLSVEDDGKGFDVEEVSKKSLDERGMGLAAMNERAHMLQASIDIESQIGKGSRIVLTIPT